MFNESRTNFVAVSGALKTRHPEVFETLSRELTKAGITLHEILGSRNIWTRDYLPIQVDTSFVKFRYGYGNDNSEFESLKTRCADWSWLDTLRHPVITRRPDELMMKGVYGSVEKSNIRLDGGNLIRNGEDAIMTDIIFEHNPTFKRTKLLAKLEKILQAEITVVPTEPDDDIGHADGICHFVPRSGKLLVHDYRKAKTAAYHGYFKKLIKALQGFEIVLFPYGYANRPKISESEFRATHPDGDTWNQAAGYYLNLLLVGNLVFLPQFGIPEDDDAVEVAKVNFPNCKIVPVDCKSLSLEGGNINCVTNSYTF